MTLKGPPGRQKKGMPKRKTASYDTTGPVGFYEKKVKKYGDDVRSPAWGSRESQEKRFETLSQITDLEGKSLLDVGCGLGDFYGWLKERYHNIRYTGIDIAPSMIKTASKKYPEVSFKVKDILEIKREKAYDYVLSSGIFNRRIPGHKNFVKDSVRRMFELCKEGMAFNIMSQKADFKEKDEYYADPGEMLDFCLGLSRKVVLRHDYMTHDFTVYIYK